MAPGQGQAQGFALGSWRSCLPPPLGSAPSSLARAWERVPNRRNQLDGDHSTLLEAAAEKLSQAHPLAATIAMRSMVDFTLSNARSSRSRR